MWLQFSPVLLFLYYSTHDRSSWEKVIWYCDAYKYFSLILEVRNNFINIEYGFDIISSNILLARKEKLKISNIYCHYTSSSLHFLKHPKTIAYLYWHNLLYSENSENKNYKLLQLLKAEGGVNNHLKLHQLDVTDHSQRLQFSSGKKISEISNISFKIILTSIWFSLILNQRHAIKLRE